ncbi:MAG: hypothetical protein AUH81_19975 [Candidatus Rokubacteria bacterium 13_1_40CM_4_69_5]|nr:MAG: hypothetical protein AUH81_19975 [Candidatus Rokubacteria bacterium 13_1_40CM_4_69_5]OLE36618.1 MAG: hypothetical protein AUG00_10170 [Candidatus Rokubacteria bacterium 13_1_20CM_2_70_7]
MRLGCGGCLVALTCLVVLLVGGFAGLFWFVLGVFQQPDLQTVAANPADWRSAQQKIYALARRSRAGSGRVAEPTVLSEGEINAFLSRQLADAADLPLAAVTVRLRDDGAVEFRGRVPLRAVLTEPPMPPLVEMLPPRWLERPLWLHLRARARLELAGGRQRRYLRLDVTHFWLGQRRLPAFLFRLIVNPATLRLLRSPVPETIEGLVVEPGRVVIRTAS